MERAEGPQDGHLEVNIRSCKMRNITTSEQDPIRSYFLLLQLEEQGPTAISAKPQKYRTDIQSQVFRSEDLVFQKNVFKFTNCNPYEQILIRVACFQVETRGKGARPTADMSAISLI